MRSTIATFAARARPIQAMLQVAGGCGAQVSVFAFRLRLRLPLWAIDAHLSRFQDSRHSFANARPGSQHTFMRVAVH